MNRHALRELALELLDSAADEADQRAGELVEGRWRLFDEFEHAGRRYFVAIATGEPLLEAGEITLLRRRARGCSIKELAVDVGVSEATISRRLARVMRRLGLSGQPQLARVWAAAAGREC